LILSFFYAYRDKDDNLITNQKKITSNYLSLWFWIDLSTIIPINLIMEGIQTTKNQKGNGASNTNSISSVGRVLRLPKIYRLIRMLKFLKTSTGNSNNNKGGMGRQFIEKLKLRANLEKLVYFLLGFLVITHIFSCIWYLIAKLQNFNENCWVYKLGYLDESNFDLYMHSVYWTLTTVTTVGYGDVSAFSLPERLYNLFIMFIGVLMYSFAIGWMTTIVANLDRKSSEIRLKLAILDSLKSEFKIDEEVFKKVRKVIKFDMFKLYSNNDDFLNMLPNKLKMEMSKIIYENEMKKFYFFDKKGYKFLGFVSDFMTLIRLNKNEVIYEENDIIDESKIFQILFFNFLILFYFYISYVFLPFNQFTIYYLLFI